MNNPKRLHRYGTILVWAGVLVWVPYFALRMAGENPSMFVYLPFHLLGVIGGARMRSAANKQLGRAAENHDRYKWIARIIIIASILVWFPYYALKLSGRSVGLQPYLGIHLVGIFIGMGLLGARGAAQYFRSKRMD